MWGLWFAAALSDAGIFHSCPVHSHAVLESHGSHASHASHMAPVSSGAKDPQHRHGDCTCLSPCRCGTPIAVPTRVQESFVDAIVDVPTHEYCDVERPSIDRAYVQPFANGPPSAI